MTDQQFCLRWNNHQSTLVAVFDGLLEKGVLVDCTLAAEGQQLTAHKVVLAACSPFLETLLSRHYDKHPILILKDVKFSELKAMMDYMYRGEVNISQDQLGTFLKAAESLQIKGLSDGGNEKDPYPAKRHHDRKPLRPTSPLRNSMPDSKRVPPPPYLHNNSIRNSMKSSPLLFDIPEDSPVNRGRDSSLSPVPRKKKRPRETEDPLNNNVVTKSENTSDEAPTNHKDSGDEPARVPSPDLKPDPTVEKTDPIAHLKHELIEEEEDINDDSMELTLAEDDMGEPGPSHDEGDYQGDFFSGTQDGDNKDGQDLGHINLLKASLEAWRAATQAQSLSKVLQSQQQQQQQPQQQQQQPRNCSPVNLMNLNNLPMPSSPTANGAESPKNVECGRCGRRYKLKSSLRNHQKWECGKEPRFQCPYCVYRAKQKMHVERHIERMHKDQLRAFYDSTETLLENDVNLMFADKMKDISGKLLADVMSETIRQA